VREQVADGHAWAMRDIGKVFGELVVERKLVLFRESQDRGSGELLADRSDAEFGVGSNRSFLRDGCVFEAEADLLEP